MLLRADTRTWAMDLHWKRLISPQLDVEQKGSTKKVGYGINDDKAKVIESENEM